MTVHLFVGIRFRNRAAGEGAERGAGHPNAMDLRLFA